MATVLMVFGTRPEAIKMAPLYLRLMEERGFRLRLCVTGQHREMLDQALSIFDIEPDYDLRVMRDGQDLIGVTDKILVGIRDVIAEVKPDIVLVHGDTTTCFATATACFFLGVKVGHVEAGLRTFDLSSPFPEEFNRQATCLVADYHFAPTQEARINLLNSRVRPENILVTGNTVIDSLQLMLGRVAADPAWSKGLKAGLKQILGFDHEDSPFVLVTGHRRENFGGGFLEICKAIRELATEFVDLKFVYPVHLNPNVQAPVSQLLGGIENVSLIEPISYESFVLLLDSCLFVLTDSGGIQEEAPSLGKPVFVMRDVTERPEAVAAGTVKLVGALADQIVENCRVLISDPRAYDAMAQASNPFGDGNASERITSFLKAKLNV